MYLTFDFVQPCLLVEQEDEYYISKDVDVVYILDPF